MSEHTEAMLVEMQASAYRRGWKGGLRHAAETLQRVSDRPLTADDRETTDRIIAVLRAMSIEKELQPKP